MSDNVVKWLSDREKAELRIAMKKATQLSHMEIERVLNTRDRETVRDAELYIQQCFVTIKHPESVVSLDI